MSVRVRFVGTPFRGEDALVHGTHNDEFIANWTWCGRRCVGPKHALLVVDVEAGTAPCVGAYETDAAVTCLECLAVGAGELTEVNGYAP